MTERKDPPEKATSSSNVVVSHRTNAKLKHDEKRGGFDVLADEEPQICRSID